MTINKLISEFKFSWQTVIKIIIITLLLILPYYIFEGKLFIGGDDTKLFYSYPFEFLRNVTYFSWYNVSSIGINTSNQYLLPFLSIWSLLAIIINNKIILSYFGFSLPLIIGFIYFKKFVKEFFDLNEEYNFEITLGSLFYILSPILILDQLFIFLTSVWLIGLVPAIGYYYLRYISTSKFIHIYKAMVMCFIFSFAILAIPWLLGYLLPMFFGAITLAFLSKRKEVIHVIKRTIFFASIVLLPQSFWLLGFIAPYIIQDKTSFAAKFLSKGFLDTFAPTIIATATGYIIYPLLNLYHRQIAFDFDWKLKNEFINLYDKTIFLNLIFIAIITIGILNYKKYLDKLSRGKYLFILSALLLSLYFFTVNIGPLKDLFLLLGRVPGFVMFRNFYDKFAPGFTFLYAMFITISLVLVKKRYPKKYKYFNYFMLFVIILNFSTVKSTVNSPLWTTENAYKTITIPDEYLKFMNTIKNNTSSTNNILSVPFGSSVYTVIKDETSNNVYVGTSPVKIFSGVNDISGYLSFLFSKEADKMDKIIADRDYKEFNKILYNHNINYVLVTKNIPKQALSSYAFNKNTLVKQDKEFLHAITDKKIATSEKGNYDLYTTKKSNTLLESKNLTFKKINSVEYTVYIKNIKSTQIFKFNDSYQIDWRLYLQKYPSFNFCNKIFSGTRNIRECKSEFSFFNIMELTYLWEKSIFNDKHSTIDGTTNIWKIDPEYIKKNYSKDYYKVNKDGSIDIEMILYFKPQLYLYYGLMISFITLVTATGYLIIIFYKNHENYKN